MYTFWAASSIHERWRVTGDTAHVTRLYPELLKNYDSWVKTHYSHRYQCMFQASHADGEENSAGLDGCRPTINAMMVAEARSLAAMGAAAGAPRDEISRLTADAERWASVLTEQLWDDGLSAFVTRTVPPPRALWDELRSERIVTYFGCLACAADRTCPPPQGWPEGKRVPVRELQGLSSPWYFSALPKTTEAVDKYAASFAELRDPEGFGARWGPRTCERRSPCYNFSTEAQCNWHGSSWPYETSKTLTGLANLLQGYPPQAHVSHDDFVALLAQYARAHTKSYRGGSTPPGIDEDLHPDEGWWITREKLLRTMPNNPHKDRGEHYFHSSYVDVVVSGLGGIVPPEPPEKTTTTATTGDGGIYDGGGNRSIRSVRNKRIQGEEEEKEEEGRGGGEKHRRLNLVVHPLVGGAPRGTEERGSERVGGSSSRGEEEEVAPPAPVEWFALIGVVVHGREVSVVWDHKGERYPDVGAGPGLHVWVDGKLAASSPELTRLSVAI